MNAFSLMLDYFSFPTAQSVDDLLYGDETSSLSEVNWQSWEVCIYDCIVKSKELMGQVKNLNAPLIWLLPALSYQSELKQVLQSSLQQLYPEHAQHFLFYGASSVHFAVGLAKKNEWVKVNVIAIDTIYKANKQGQYSYQGIGGAVTTLEQQTTGWSQISNEIVPSVDFIKHNQLNGMFTRLADQSQQLIDIIFAPGNGVNPESEVWLNELQLLSNLINDHTQYELPCYKLGQIGALEGLVVLYQLTTSPTIESHCKNALIISQEQAKHQGAASYLWISEEVHN
ncbi:hypothetical protein [Pseudoalteromonas sp. TAB23]|uniref:hypothetical protein n=1 Tax=Pseudoalteromonas sp. TAB23 TaxID=1938595 RepID=UPI00041BB6F4|nr:hypothetical protein [Pseudoalteromonas sp. TAB23]